MQVAQLMIMRAGLCVLLHLLRASAFNYTTCPSPVELQNPALAFHLSRFAGTYYEIALHDYTQYPACPLPTCVRSVKKPDAATSKLHDAWQLSCLGGTYPEDLEFNITSQPGYFLGTWSVLPGVVFPDTVVDAGPVLPSGQYAWVIELQCVQVDTATSSEVVFVGINFYHYLPTPGAAALQQMFAAARVRGLEVFLNHSFGVYTVPQTNCSWAA